MSKKTKETRAWWEEDTKQEKCEACGSTEALTKHHLIPVSMMKNKYAELKPSDESNVIILCRSCHDSIHASYTEQELRDLYNTKEALLNAPKFKKDVAWKLKHPNFNGHSKMARDQKNRR